MRLDSYYNPSTSAVRCGAAMSGSNAISASATVCSVSGRWDQERTVGVFSFRYSSYKSPSGATLSPVSYLPSGSNSWSTTRSGSALLNPFPRGRLENFRECGGYHRPGEAGKTRDFSVDAAVKIERPRGSQQGRAFRGSKLTRVGLHDHRMSTLLCFRAATFELVSCYSRSSGEIQKQRESRGRRQDLSIVKALQDDSIYEREEQRWLREEQRWLREEQRWLREEARLSAVNQVLQEEVKSLKKDLEELRGQRVYNGEVTDISLRNLVAGMRNLLQALAIPGSEDFPLLDSSDAVKQIAGSVHRSGETSTTFIVENSESIVSPVTFMASPDKVIAVVTPKTASGNTPEPKSPPPAPPSASQAANGATSNSPTTSSSKSRTTTTTASKRNLKSGMEGDDVKELQDALSELGFYSGEEDIEFSVFSDGTESAVKTWQSTQGIPEDGRVSKELMAALVAEVAAKITPGKVETKKVTKSNTEASTKVETNPKTKQPSQATKQPAASSHLGTREIDRYERSNAQETGSGSARRVYLLGENRWEEPDRVMKKQEEDRRKTNGSTITMKVGVQMCFQCRGIGTMLCTDCEGTGDLNVEEQFLEWIDEDQAKCPYCEGSGAVECDSCYGRLINIQK